MKAALLISGYTRSLKLNYDSIKKNIINKFEKIDIYIHVTENEYIDDKYLNNIEDISNIIKELNPICLINEANYSYYDKKESNNIFNNFFKFYKLNHIKKSNEIIFGKYDIVIKYRPDLNITSDNIFDMDITSDIIYIPSDSKIDKAKLENINDKYICDVFAYGNSHIMDKYFDIFLHLSNLLKLYGFVSETILYHYLNDFNIEYKLIDIEYSVILSMCNIFAICGDSGTGKTTLGNLLKKYFSNSFMLECDRYHKWERGNGNWDNYTHLNPEANYITKMNEDIFNLKAGNTIYQVDYDHKTGKFTEKKQINSNDNIIICGLHSLYTNDNIYNIKIFMDTDNTLKKVWKIKRDINKRGYTYEQILKQIEAREKDYYKYILPQKDNADIIVNFFTTDSIDLIDLNKELKEHLRILIKKEYNIEHILLEFNRDNIEYESVYNDMYHEIIFFKYKKFNNNEISTNNFYEYILFILLNIKQAFII